MTKKTLDTPVPNNQEFSVAFLLSEFRKDFRLIDQKFQHIDQKFDHVDKRFQHIDQKFDRINERIDKQSAKIDRNFYWTIGILLASVVIPLIKQTLNI